MAMSEWLLISGMALVTGLIRYPMIALSGRLRLPERLLQALKYVPPAVLTAIVVPAVVIDQGALWLSWQNARIVGAIAALAIGLWRQNLLLTIVVGMAVFLLWQGFGYSVGGFGGAGVNFIVTPDPYGCSNWLFTHSKAASGEVTIPSAWASSTAARSSPI